ETGDPRAKQPWLVAVGRCASGDARELEAAAVVLLETDDAEAVRRAAETLRAVRDLPPAAAVKAQIEALVPRLDERVKVLRGAMPAPSAPAWAPIIATGNPFYF